MNNAYKKSLSNPEITQENWQLKDHLTGDWNKRYKIDQNAPFTFKFLDNAGLMKNLKSTVKSSQELTRIFKEQLSFSDKERETKLWLKVGENIVQMTLFDVYTSFLHYLKDKSYEDQLFNVNEVSFMGPLGPFSSLPLIQCLNDRVIHNYIYSAVAQNKIPARKLRVSTEGHIKIAFGAELAQSADINIKQITDTGILFSSSNEFVIDDMSKSEFVKFHVDTRNLKNFLDNDLVMSEKKEEFFYSSDDLRYFYIEEKNIQKSLSYRSDETNEFFLFCRFHDMLESDTPTIFLEFLEKLEDYFKFLSL